MSYKTQHAPNGPQPQFPAAAVASSLHYHVPVDWAAVLTPLFAEIDRHSRRAAREEYERLLIEQSAAAELADKNDKVLTVQQAAELIGIRPQTVYEWIKADKLRAHKAGRAVRLKKGDVLAALQVQTQPDGRRKYARRTTNKKAQ